MIHDTKRFCICADEIIKVVNISSFHAFSMTRTKDTNQIQIDIFCKLLDVLDIS